jgi:hypothetical protein
MSRPSRSRAAWRWPAAMLLAAALAPAHRGDAQASDSIHLRPTSVTVTIENDKLYSGVYNASGISTICGHVELGYPGYEKSFSIEFPDEETPGVRSLTFDAKALPPGSSTTSFHLNVGVRVGERGAPPLYVVRADEPQYNEPGVAELVNDKGTTSLTVTGTAALGVKVRVKAVCSPKDRQP